MDLRDIAGMIDGVLLTGSPSHVAPACYGEKQRFEDKDLDPARDATTLPLIQQTIDMDKPMLAICRGFQELNVVLGGTLHQFVHELPGKLDHRVIPGSTIREAYHRQGHKVIVNKGGIFERMQVPAEFSVNTIHQQGIDKLGEGLHVEAVSEDGLIEAVSMPGKSFILGTQWHPEGDWDINDMSRKIFEAFGTALRQREFTSQNPVPVCRG
jgi:putative glutamine amidotransferase